MTHDELKAMVLLGSYLEEKTVGTIHLKPSFPRDIVPKQQLIVAADELTADGLIQPIEGEASGIPESQVWPCSWKITPRGRDILERPGKEPSVPLSFGIVDFNIIIATGRSSVTQTKNQVATDTKAAFEQHMTQQINQSQVTDQEKQEAKSKLTDFLEHPLLSTVIGAALGSLLKGS